MKHGKVVVVTGASGGVGRATARAFAERGARVALLARGREGLAAAADEVERAGGEALVVSVGSSAIDFSKMCLGISGNSRFHTLVAWAALWKYTSV